ncbi:hypothetical protein GMSM_08060 [Geomonas sp. Red276]
MVSQLPCRNSTAIGKPPINSRQCINVVAVGAFAGEPGWELEDYEAELSRLAQWLEYLAEGSGDIPQGDRVGYLDQFAIRGRGGGLAS